MDPKGSIAIFSKVLSSGGCVSDQRITFGAERLRTERHWGDADAAQPPIYKEVEDVGCKVQMRLIEG